MIGVVAGFVVTEKILEKRGYRRRAFKLNLKLEELPKYLEKRFLAKSAVVTPSNKVLVGVEENEVEKSLELLSSLSVNELVTVSGSDYTYITKFGDVVVFVKGKFASMRDLSEVWMVVHHVLRGGGS